MAVPEWKIGQSYRCAPPPTVLQKTPGKVRRPQVPRRTQRSESSNDDCLPGLAIGLATTCWSRTKYATTSESGIIVIDTIYQWLSLRNRCIVLVFSSQGIWQAQRGKECNRVTRSVISLFLIFLNIQRFLCFASWCCVQEFSGFSFGRSTHCLGMFVGVCSNHT